MAEETIERRFDVAVPARLRVGNIRGAVDIQPGEDNVIVVSAVKDVESGDAERTEVEILQDEEGTVKVKTEFRKGLEWLFDWRRPCKVRYTIHVPRSCSVKVRCVSSDASLRDLQGEVDLETVSGDVQLENLNGRLRLRSVSGDIRGAHLVGTLDLETVSGDVRLSASDLPQAKASSVSGDGRLETSLGRGPYRLKTVSGDFELLVPAESRCTVETSTISGELRTTLPVTTSSGDRRHRRVEVQGGGVEVTFNSVSGDLRLTPSGKVEPGAAPEEPKEAPAVEAAPPVAGEPPSPPVREQALRQARREILERVARGELTAEQGVEELRQL